MKRGIPSKLSLLFGIFSCAASVLCVFSAFFAGIGQLDTGHGEMVGDMRLCYHFIFPGIGILLSLSGIILAIFGCIHKDKHTKRMVAGLILSGVGLFLNLMWLLPNLI